mgnify:CR=1 FL=1
MYGVLRSFLTGLIDVAAKRQLELEEQGDDSNMGGDWSRISANDTELERFRQGIDFIIDGHSHSVMTKGKNGEPSSPPVRSSPISA